MGLISITGRDVFQRELDQFNQRSASTMIFVKAIPKIIEAKKPDPTIMIQKRAGHSPLSTWSPGGSPLVVKWLHRVTAAGDRRVARRVAINRVGAVDLEYRSYLHPPCSLARGADRPKLNRKSMQGLSKRAGLTRGFRSAAVCGHTAEAGARSAGV